MDWKRVAIIGADCISVSIALGLKAQENPPEIVGCDADAAAAKLARSKGAFDRVERRAGQACRDADLVIIAVPLPAVRETFAAIAPHLQPGCLVTDTASLKTPVLRWAEELLPQGVSFVGGRVIPNPAIVGFDPLEGLEAASAGLLKGALYCITTSPHTPGAGVNALVALAKTLAAQPLLIDATEHDGLQAGVEGLPDLLAVALLRVTVDTPGWREMRKFAGLRFAIAIHDAADADERHAAISLNRENVLLRLDLLLQELVRLRDLLTDGDAQAVENAFAAAAEGRARWTAEREQGLWVKDLATADTGRLPSGGDRLLQMLFGGLASPRARKPDRLRQK
jgi:prephenate dehydrogenase